jgi:hypothetical protein
MATSDTDFFGFGDKETFIQFLLKAKQEQLAEAYQLLKAEFGPDVWLPLYRNSESGKIYKPHHREEADFVFNDAPANCLVKGGEGSGKSAAGVVKDLERLRRSMNGVMVSPDLPHFKRSLWPEFKRWCPWQHVVASQQYRGRAEWEPSEAFTLTFKTGASVICGGIESPGAWEGPNLSWAHFDEARRHKTPEALKVLAGRVRIQGQHGEMPQLWLTTTPKKHWLFDYFGPVKSLGEAPDGDALAEFKKDSLCIILKTLDNEVNTYEGFAEKRGQSLTPAEKRVILDAEWEDIDETDRFLPSITWWDSCYDPALPPFEPRTPMVLGVDAGIKSDCFAVVGVTRHPLRRDDVAVRYSRLWTPRPGQPVNLTEVREEIKALKAEKGWYIAQVAYDPYQLEMMMEELGRVMWTEAFNQQSDREKSDKLLYDLITQGRLAHDGNHPDLKQHLQNADRKLTGDDRKMRIVKREETAKVDLAVATSMACYRCLVELNL